LSNTHSNLLAGCSTFTCFSFFFALRATS
jgi:hypothetical protein